MADKQLDFIIGHDALVGKNKGKVKDDKNDYKKAKNKKALRGNEGKGKHES